jgi:hypothetical protein
MAKARATKSKAGGMKPATATKRKPASKAKTASKAKAKATAKAKAKSPAKRASILGGVAKGIAWLGDKVRGVVTRKKPTKKRAKSKAAKSAKPAKSASAPPTGSSDNLVTLYNPLP